ncbi:MULTISPECIES: hypothetical protein [unclassified Oleiphilus]|jgi:sensor domain CHASE-containing protein|uniref:hypothetical protein n=2 Tax=unclassified Oleiphilus TaxID=2631174 RepID=UPI0007C32E22|nr:MULTISPECIES: hypothetical protein [unclassified Oleiphilus]KZY41875.1 hypothetical protein A3732_17410 [Oleiphilus sp. HI0050]KZY73794.1 hypothetical protein A3740_03190 [Oleiphilus sp. HI0068]KZY80315.1 hypothetical protein A3741_05845 [Oleiphilus sp. HI0069]KZY96596.1 hypothetical protein A3743_21930 [Oleiphilus sp. HI0072]KZZ11926.1 hypothetical protein A3749_00865 [Oleiphilus sp. HI0078]KZZ21021.1 hypothetical protein A3752_10040 [Oleiphilus sp. HI0081]KZZ42556.1 hypothetical protein
MYKFRDQLLLTLLVVGLLPSLVISFQTYLHSKAQVTESTVEIAQKSLMLVANGLQFEFDHGESLVQEYARSAELSGL